MSVAQPSCSPLLRSRRYRVTNHRAQIDPTAVYSIFISNTTKSRDPPNFPSNSGWSWTFVCSLPDREKKILALREPLQQLFLCSWSRLCREELSLANAVFASPARLLERWSNLRHAALGSSFCTCPGHSQFYLQCYGTGLLEHCTSSQD